MVLRSLATDHRVVDESGGKNVVASAAFVPIPIASAATKAKIGMQLAEVVLGWIN